MKNNINISGITALLTLLCASSVYAGGDVEAAKPTPGLLDNGLISLTKLAPPITRVSDYSGDIWNRNTMFGDLDGVRSDWYDKGFSFDMQVTQVYQGVTSGGTVPSNHRGAYNGLLEINSYLDTAKMGWWSGGLLATTLQSSWGNPLSSEAGNLSPVNMTPFWPVPFHNTTRFTELYLTQGLPDNMLLILGRIDATNFLDTNLYANIPESQFLNASLNNDLMWGNMLTFSTYAALLIVPVNERFTVAVGAWTPETQPDDYSGDWGSWAVVINPMYSYKLGGEKGKAQITYAYSSADTSGFDNPRISPDSSTDIISIMRGMPSKTDNWLVTFNLQQHLWTPEGSADYATGTQDFANNPPGIGFFYRLGYMPENRNMYNLTMSGGFGGRGVIEGRPNDRMGLGLYGMWASNDFKNSSFLLDALLRDEMGVEAYYNFAITPWLQVSVDAQYIDQGLKTSNDAWVMGSRLNIRF
jgi:porin